MANEKVKATEPVPPSRNRRAGPKSVAETAREWKTLLTNVRSHLPDMPHLAADLAELERLLASVESSVAEQTDLKGRIGLLARGRVVELEQGRELRRRLVAQLQGRFGAKSEALRGFGIKPRKRSRTMKQIEGEPQAPEPEEPEPEPSPTVVKIE
jgi:hypothetical protein